ncbi:MAG: DEAD/DEAH box helicase family protein, partial [Candidatus Hydrothermarchaeales archaeon]
MIHLSFHKGTILVKGNVRPPNTVWDPRANCFRGMALYYQDILDYLKRSGIEFVDEVMDTVLCPELKADLKLRDYQEDALSTWFRSGKRGVIVLPTGSGKTVIGIEAISLCNVSSLVVVPTLDLMDQWKQRLESEFNVEVGSYGGGSHELQGITMSTYDTAYLRAEELGNKFALIIFDEVHHLPAPGYSNIAEMFASPYRLGLTATYEREDGLHKELPR